MKTLKAGCNPGGCVMYGFEPEVLQPSGNLV